MTVSLSDDSARVQARWQADLQLARRCVADPAAQRELFDRHVDAVYGLALRLSGQPADAQDVTQEAFVEIFSSLPTYRAESSLRTWLHRITVRVASRHRRRRFPLELVPEAVDSDATAPDLAQTADRRQAVSRLNALLGQIAAGRRAIFVLHEIEGYSLPEAAALLRISVTAARKKICRARRDLDRLVQDDPLLRSYLAGGLRG